jgi:hypothetical protein
VSGPPRHPILSGHIGDRPVARGDCLGTPADP